MNKARKAIVKLDDLTEGVPYTEFHYQNSLKPRYIYLESFYIEIMPHLLAIFNKRNQEHMSFQKMSRELEGLGILTPYGKKTWCANTIRRLYLRWVKNSQNPRWFFCDENKS